MVFPGDYGEEERAKGGWKMQLLWHRVECCAPSELYFAMAQWDGRVEERLREKLAKNGWNWPAGGVLPEVGTFSALEQFAVGNDGVPGLNGLLQWGAEQQWELAETVAAVLVLCWMAEAGVQVVFSFPHRIALDGRHAADLDGLVVRPTEEKGLSDDGAGAKTEAGRRAMIGLLRILRRLGKLEYISEAAPPAFQILGRRKVGEGAFVYVVQTVCGGGERCPGSLPIGNDVRQGHGHIHEHIDEGMVLLQANIDDMNPEWLPYAMEKLLEHGANDVYAHPVQMKKGRIGFLLNVLCERSKSEVLKAVIFSETSTIGVRALDVAVHRLGRTVRVLESPWGPIRVKEAKARGKRVQAAPEFEDCRRIAQERGVPLKKVYEWVTARLGMSAHETDHPNVTR